MHQTFKGRAGVERGSVRVSYEYGALAFAYDPARASLAAVVRGLEGTGLTWIKIGIARRRMLIVPRRTS